MNQFKKTAIALGVAQIVMMSSGVAMAQVTPAPASTATPTAADKAPAAGDPSVIVVTGQRAALRSAQKIKQDADEIVDSIVAEDIGKLPDRSVTEVLQRIAGVTIDHTMSDADPEHFSVEGSGVTIRGLSYVRSELNGRDEFSANGGRSLNFEDVPPELMAGVDVYKNPSAEQIEGAIGGLVNLRTAMPFDFKGMKGSFSVQDSYSTLAGGSPSPSFSGMFSNRWTTDAGQFGVLIDLAHSESKTRTDAIQVDPYYPLTNGGNTVWVPKGVEYRTLDFDRKRDGLYGAIEWKKADAYSSLTFFDSHYNMQWNEQALFGQSNAYNIKVANGVYDANGNFVSGTLSDSADGGINLGDDTRTANRISDTKDLSWKLRFKPSSAWTLTSDAQYIHSTTHSFDSTVGTGIQIPGETVNLAGGGVPQVSFTAADMAYMANPNNYYWAYTMEHKDQGLAHEFAWKGDAKFEFDDPVLRDIRFGVRLTGNSSLTVNSNPSYNWAAITQPWQLGWDINSLAYLGDPRFSGNSSLHTFNNFFNGAISVPALVFPNVSTTTGYPASYAALHAYTSALCVNPGCNTWAPATFGTDPAGSNSTNEQTQALFSQLRFEFDKLKYPVDGNVGLRYVLTESVAHGYTSFTPSLPSIPAGANVTGETIPSIAAFAKAQDFTHSYVDVLPALNLRMKASDQLQFRFAYSTAMARPDPSQLQAYTTLSENITSTTNTATNNVNISNVGLTGVAVGNPMLKPTTSNQVDLTAEWYFSKVGSLTLSVFDKKLKDIIINQTYNYPVPDSNGTMQDFTVTGPINGASGTARGFELAYQQYFDMLPGWLSGFGVQGNFTFVDSHTNLYSPVNQAYCTGGTTAANLALNLNGCDTNGQTFGDLPLQNLSRRSYNLSLMYDRGPISARLAYNWRSKYLQAVNVNGTQGTDGTDTNPASPTYGQHNVSWGLPTWAGDYGQLDASIFYKVTEDLTFGLEAQNINNAIYEQMMQQHNGLEGRAWFSTGPRYTAQMRYSF